MDRPILIAAVPRSGSSLIAKIFVAHGIWCGDCKVKSDQHAIAPYPAYESIAIDDWIFKRLQFNSGSICDFDTLISTINPASKRWLYKAKPRFIKYLMDIEERLNPVVIKTTRDESNIVKSWGSKHANLQSHMNTLNMINGITVSSDAVMARDFKTLESAFDICELEFNVDIAESCIDDDLWHHKL